MATVETADPSTESARPRAAAHCGWTSFAADVLKLASGSGIAQALGILVGPLLTRLYAPEAFGMLAIFTSIASIIGVVACLRYELAIVLPEADAEAANLLAVSLLTVGAVTVLTVLMVVFGGPLITMLLKAPELRAYLWLVPVMVLLSGLSTALSYWNSRNKQFGRLSLARLFSSLSTQASKVSAGCMGYASGTALIGASIVGPAVSSVMLVQRMWYDGGSMLRLSITWSGMFQASKRYRRFPLIDTWSALLNTVSWQLPTFVLSYFFSSTVVGCYALGLRTLQLPMAVVGAAIAQVFFQRAAEAKADGTLARFVETTFARLVTLGLFPMLTLAIVGRETFSIVYGQQWIQAGVYTQILSLWTFFWFISSPLSALFSVLEKQDLLLGLNIGIILTRFLSLWLGGILGSPEIALLAFSLSGVLLYGWLVLRIMVTSGVAWASAGTILEQALLGFIPSGLLLLAFQWAHLSSWVIVLTAGVLVVIHYIRAVIHDPQLSAMLHATRVRSHVLSLLRRAD